MSPEIPFHPLADIFPPMQGAEFDALVADIKANGLQLHIILYDGMILDGRNRYRACVAAGWDQFAIREMCLNGDLGGWIDDPAAYVISANIRRRHLNADDRQKFLIQVIAAAPEKSDRALAKETGLSHPTIAKARKQGEATGKVLPVEKRAGADGKARKQPIKKAKTRRRKPRRESTPHQPKVISQEDAEKVGTVAARLIKHDPGFARKLAGLLMDDVARTQFWVDLTTLADILMDSGLSTRLWNDLTTMLGGEVIANVGAAPDVRVEETKTPAAADDLPDFLRR